MYQWIFEVVAGGRTFAGHDVCQGALSNHLPTPDAGPWANVDDVLGAANGVVIVLDHHQGVAVTF